MTFSLPLLRFGGLENHLPCPCRSIEVLRPRSLIDHGTVIGSQPNLEEIRLRLGAAGRVVWHREAKLDRFILACRLTVCYNTQ